MSVRCQAICEAIELLAPKHLAEEWDNCGLQVGNFQNEVKRVLIALDVTPEIIQQGKKQNVQMIIAHHPLIFKPLKSICTDTVLGGTISEAIKNDIAIYVAHTNLDIAQEGINHLLACKLDLQQTELLSASYQENMMKIVVFVPMGSEDTVRNAMAEAGAGWIGNYSHCFFQAKGTGTFMPREGTNPYIGRQDVLEKVEECRMETIVGEKQAKRVLAAMIKSHPYEEVAYDIYPLANEVTLGLGRVGKLPEPVELSALAEKIKIILGCTTVKVVGDAAKTIKKVAVCGGSGASLMGKAIFAGADVLLTGDVKYHEAQEAAAQGMAVIDAGHFATERIIVPALADYLKDYARERDWNLEVLTAREQDVFNYI